MNSEIASAYARFFDAGKGPSHDELDRLFAKANFGQFDPAPDPSNRTAGKLKRVRGALLDGEEADKPAALAFVIGLTAMLKARGCFDLESDQYADGATVRATQAAMKGAGWRLEESGDLYPSALAGLDSRDLSDALQQYVRRIQRGADDDALTIGTAKDLLEAVARHVMVERTGVYDARADFPTTLFRASTVLGVGLPTGKMINELDKDPFLALEQALLLAALAVSRLRNEVGTGHGRPQPTPAMKRQGIVTAHAAAAVAHVLLHELTE